MDAHIDLILDESALRMCSGPDKNHQTMPVAVVKPVNQQKVPADVTFTVSVPFFSSRPEF
jgi:hypothetical protein